MTRPLAREAVSTLFVAACLAELRALKPGNVHIHAGGHGMEVRHFEAAARAAAPFIADPGLRVGARVEGAVKASFAAAGCNANLGIVLLCTPLAAAAEALPTETGAGRLLRESLSRILARLGRDDAAGVFRAISHAGPAGLGTVEAEDVSRPPSLTLREAMALAQHRDRIARAYVSDFEEIFTFGLPELEAARRAGVSEDEAIATVHMRFLASFPDSHIARKHGPETAEAVCADARARTHLWSPAVRPETLPGLLSFDRELKARGLNPGTTADFVVATLFADGILGRGVARPSP
jgi:triphosphoribosyl-dephospho-CoA synthase